MVGEYKKYHRSTVHCLRDGSLIIGGGGEVQNGSGVGGGGGGK